MHNATFPTSLTLLWIQNPIYNKRQHTRWKKVRSSHFACNRLNCMTREKFLTRKKWTLILGKCWDLGLELLNRNNSTAYHCYIKTSIGGNFETLGGVGQDTLGILHGILFFWVLTDQQEAWHSSTYESLLKPHWQPLPLNLLRQSSPSAKNWQLLAALLSIAVGFNHAVRFLFSLHVHVSVARELCILIACHKSRLDALWCASRERSFVIFHNIRHLSSVWPSLQDLFAGVEGDNIFPENFLSFKWQGSLCSLMGDPLTPHCPWNKKAEKHTA